ncbi:hypothetical protein [Mumia quercus]|uniref:hypothetical protein n=1 Tax=Mumia quercus TaxID=2976125 RepID=UPI0021D25F5C|nr:hypothetical protein [Mumia quercus]
MTNWRRSGLVRALPLALLPALLAGCGDDASGSASTLSGTQLGSVLLTVDDLAPGFEPVSGSGASGAESGTRVSLNDIECLAGLDVSGADGAATASVAFTRFNLLTITSSATSFPDDDVADVFDETSEAVSSCSDFEATAENGSGIRGRLDADSTPASDDVDAQVNVRLTGTQQPSGAPVEITFGWARIGNDVVFVSSEGVGGPSEESFQELMRTTTDRLAEVRTS